MIWRFTISALFLAGLSGCGPSYSPDTYASNAAQQANKVEQGTIVGVRDVSISAAGTVGTVTGAAAGGIAGSQAVAGPISAFTALGGSLVGGIAGSTVEHATADTVAFEYIVRKKNGDLVSVTQKDKTPLALGQKVLVIAGNQARVVPDYTVPPSMIATKAAAEAAKADPATADGKNADGSSRDNSASEAPPSEANPANATAAAPAAADAPPIAPAPAATLPATALPTGTLPTGTVPGIKQPTVSPSSVFPSGATPSAPIVLDPPKS